MNYTVEKQTYKDVKKLPPYAKIAAAEALAK
jgi:hypothetical protein